MQKTLRKVLDAKSVKELAVFPHELAKAKQEQDRQLQDIFTGKDTRFLLIVGPCSADHIDSVCLYVSKLAALFKRVSDKLFIVPRIYTSKPRSRGEGYMGILHHPQGSFEQANIYDGLIAARRMHIEAFAAGGMPCADELLYADVLEYVDDLVSYYAIGARSCQSQSLRFLASGLNVPVGIKNFPYGADFGLLDSVYAVQQPATFLHKGYEVQTSGNKFAHAILRGLVNEQGINTTNFDVPHILQFAQKYYEQGLEHPFVIIDANHSNSGKDALKQISVAEQVIQNLQNLEYAKIVKGLMIESYLHFGSQKERKILGKSLTDPCIGWEQTEQLIYQIYDKL